MDIFELVKADLDERNKRGWQSYGRKMGVGDGRDALQDAYEEALDLCMYLKKAMLERENQYCVTVPANGNGAHCCK